MQKEAIITRINELLINEFEIDASQIVPEENMLETLEIDSLDLVDVVVLIEKNFGFKVKTEEMADIETLNDFYEYVVSRVVAQQTI
jgi:acyl carrier protein